MTRRILLDRLFLASFIVGLSGMLVAWASAPASINPKLVIRPPQPPSTAACDPAAGERCVLVEYLLYRDKAVAAVYVGGVLSHCREAFCPISEPYTEAGTLDTPAKIIGASGCPDIVDGVQALTLLWEWKAAGSTEARMALPMVNKACNGMSPTQTWDRGGVVTMPTITVTGYRDAGGYGYGGANAPAYAENNSRPSVAPIAAAATIPGLLSEVEAAKLRAAATEAVVAANNNPNNVTLRDKANKLVEEFIANEKAVREAAARQDIEAIEKAISKVKKALEESGVTGAAWWDAYAKALGTPSAAKLRDGVLAAAEAFTKALKVLGPLAFVPDATAANEGSEIVSDRQRIEQIIQQWQQQQKGGKR